MRSPFNSILLLLITASVALLALGSSAPGKEPKSSALLAPGTPTPPARRATPPKATPVRKTVNEGQKGGVSPQGAPAPLAPLAEWQVIAAEGFEGVWPSTGWTALDLSNDGYDRYWDDDAYRAYSSSWAAWPANGGTDGIFPSPGNDNYPNNMDTRMIYGPFDLSNAVYGYVRFWLWREMEQGYDWLALEASHDGINFQELVRWTGSSAGNWEQPDAWLDDYVGDNSVWVSWRFYSDYSITAQGPWVDDIELWKYRPGQVTVRGWLRFNHRIGNTLGAGSMKAYLYDWDADASADFLAGPAYTGSDGYYEFPAVTNWDWDDTDTDRRLDLFVVWETDCCLANEHLFRVTNLSDQTYMLSGPLHSNVPDGTVDFGNYDVPAGGNEEWAVRIFQDLRRGREYVLIEGSTDPG